MAPRLMNLLPLALSAISTHQEQRHDARAAYEALKLGFRGPYLRSSNARACEDRQPCWKHSDFLQCEYLALANNASASSGTSSDQYRAGRGWRAPVSERGRQASTAMLQRTGTAVRP
jgi:hypothetical protein